MENLDRSKYFKVWGVYAIKDKIKDRIYIGSSKNLYNRINEHKNALSNNKHSNPFLQNHVNKYGIDSLYVEVLETNKYKNFTDLHKAEQKHLDIYYGDKCFNSHSKVEFVVDNPSNSKHLSKVIKLAWKNNYEKNLPKVLKNLEKARKSVEEKKRNGTMVYAKVNKGKHFSEEVKKKMSASAKKRGRHDHLTKAIYQYNSNGIFLKRFSCIRDAARELDLHHTASANIGACAFNRKKQAYGYIWKFFKTDFIILPLILKNIETNEETQFLDMSFIGRFLKCNPSTISRALKYNYIILNKYKVYKNE